MQKLLPRCCLFILSLFAPCAWPVTLRLAGDLWPPYVDASVPGGGVATQVVSAALARAGYTTTLEQVPWARAVQGLSEGRYDVLLTVWYNDERNRFGQHSAGYLTNRILFWRKRGSGIEFNHDLAALRQYPIAVSRGYAYSPAFTQDDALQKVPVKNFAMAAGMLAVGRVSLAVEEERVARYVLAQLPGAARERIEPLATPLAETDLRILVSLKTANHEQIVEAFDRAIGEMKADGSLNALVGEGAAADPAPPAPATP
ncbi:transporter substrate-binding domain-containing protein [Pseudomonas sp. RIT-PI-S]|uniref:substrate-binding periplasmic protein n=1 Tax=Pseudomonas sp. RIT-PI-S TaxID=3035295 RepID=UPI0021DB2F1F|nr:transporter substrate-binding domain-containing protein [Pseudomonas sp. RIT-PI-S]